MTIIDVKEDDADDCDEHREYRAEMQQCSVEGTQINQTLVYIAQLLAVISQRARDIAALLFGDRLKCQCFVVELIFQTEE